MLKEYLCDISYNRGINDGILLHKILEFLVYTVMCISLGISPLYVLNGQIHNAVLLYKKSQQTLKSYFLTPKTSIMIFLDAPNLQNDFLDAKISKMILFDAPNLQNNTF